MEQQIIISIGREFGSGGHEIATMIAEKYNLPIYDHNLLKEMAASRKLGADTVQELEAYDEQKKNNYITEQSGAYAIQPRRILTIWNLTLRKEKQSTTRPRKNSYRTDRCWPGS